MQAAYIYDGVLRYAPQFTGKERDSETGLDYFGARYYGSNMGRFLSPDWAVLPTAVPYAQFGDPQTLNLYGYVRNNPTTMMDADGHIAGVDDVTVATAVGITVAALALHYYLRQPSTERSINRAFSFGRCSNQWLLPPR